MNPAAAPPEAKPKHPRNNEIIALARSRFQLAAEAESEIRKQELEDTQFYAGQQWPDDIAKDRESDKRPCLTINRLPQIVHQVTNEQRQNRPRIQVNPVDDFDDVDTAEVIQGLVRHIEIASDADNAYDTAFESACIGGRGYFRLIPRWASADSWDQEIRFERIPRAAMVYLDPAAQKADRSDAKWGFIVRDLGRDDYKTEFPESELAGLDDFTSIGDQAPGWINRDTFRVAEYFSVETEQRTLYQLSDGSSVFKDKLLEGAVIVRERSVDVPTLYWRHINGIEVLGETTLPGEWVPIIPVLGDEVNVNGRLQLAGVVRHARDPQRMYNYWATAETEMIALAPKAPFIAAEGQIEGKERDWKLANVRNVGVLTYKPKSLDGNLVPAPQRQSYEPPVQAITQARMQAAEDLKATTGLYDASLGAKSNETSGVAIRQRQVEGDTAVFHFTDNLSRAIRHAARILVCWIPKYYDTPRVLRIIGRDDKQRVVAINQPFEEKGVQKLYNLTVGKYDVTVSTGPSYMSKRQESAAAMLQMSSKNPKLMDIAGDLIVKNMDWPGAQEIAERLKKTLPPELQDQDGKKEAPLPPKIQNQLAQMNQMIDELTASLEKANDDLRTRRLEIESRERIAALQTQAQLLMTEAKLGSQEGIIALREEIGAISRRLEQLNIGVPVTQPGDAEPPPPAQPPAAPPPAAPPQQMAA